MHLRAEWLETSHTKGCSERCTGVEQGRAHDIRGAVVLILLNLLMHSSE